MPSDQNPRVVFRVRAGKDTYNCRGHLVRDRGLVYAIPEMDDDTPFMPDRISLEESDLELRHDLANGDWYYYHGFIYIY